MVVESAMGAELHLPSGLVQIIGDTLQRLILLVFGKSWLPRSRYSGGYLLGFLPNRSGVVIHSCVCLPRLPLAFAVAFALSRGVCPRARVQKFLSSGKLFGSKANLFDGSR